MPRQREKQECTKNPQFREHILESRQAATILVAFGLLALLSVMAVLHVVSKIHIHVHYGKSNKMILLIPA